MEWTEHLWFAIPTLCGWALSVFFAIGSKSSWAKITAELGLGVYALFMAKLWINLGYPPLQTQSEIRSWFALCVVAVALGLYHKWKYKMPFVIGLIASCAFLALNIFKMDLYRTGLNPILRSHWYVPHVASYIVSYSLLASAAIGAGISLWHKKHCGRVVATECVPIDNCVYVGFAFLLFGLICGTLWAFDAWGGFWTWDPKETWALSTSIVYMIYIHVRLRNTSSALPLWMLLVAFVMLMITWVGITYLPSGENSLHLY